MQPTAVLDVSVRDLDVALREPFGIATGAQTAVQNLLVRVRLHSGAVGYGEAAPFEAVNGETRESARGAIESIANELVGRDVRRWRTIGPWLAERIPESASARCAIETAVLDALGRASGLPLWTLFGGAASSLESDMTITTGNADAARRAAESIVRDGFRTIKLKVGGKSVAHDKERALAIVDVAPSCALLLDGNCGMASVDDAVALVTAIREAGGRVVLFEQPMPKTELAAMREISERAPVPVAADESVASASDVTRVARERAANVVNVKVMKSGVIEALEIVSTARAHGLGLMIGGMVETSVAMTLSACLAAGVGGFDFVDLDTPLFMVNEPVRCEHERRGPEIVLDGITGGHGVVPAEPWS
jgi:L-alanine-DL-glutamate epimerase-like enolase superfamily enzyme